MHANLHHPCLAGLALACGLLNLHCTSTEPSPASQTASNLDPTYPLRGAVEVRPLADESRYALALAEGLLPRAVQARIEHVGVKARPAAAFTAEDLAVLKAWAGELEPPGMRVVFEEGTPHRLHFVDAAGGFIVRDATAKVTRNLHTGQLHVQIDLTTEDGQRFGDLSGRLVDRKLAIVLEDRVLSAPLVHERIDGGAILITLPNDDGGPDGVRALVSELTGVKADAVVLPPAE